MSMRKVNLIEPKFDSELMDLIIDLDFLRKKEFIGSTPPKIFSQLKDLFHILESIGSARIEGNNTTTAEYIESKLDANTGHQNNPVSNNVLEIHNIEDAMEYIESDLNNLTINHKFIRELHQIVTSNLPYPPHGEGDDNSGNYRNKNVAIKGASHIPPDIIKVQEYMDDLIEFINKNDKPKYDLLKVAIAHHRFVWIHPFNNGNGRTVRLLTYAMLIKAGFNVGLNRIINPAAVFCNNRNNYYDFLKQADSGSIEGVTKWCEYVLSGLKNEIEKIDKLLNYQYLSEHILLPAISYSLDRELITSEEAKILAMTIKQQIIQANDIKILLGYKNSQTTTRQINKLIAQKMITPESEGKRKYIIRFGDNYLLRGIMTILGEKGFLPENK